MDIQAKKLSIIQWLIQLKDEQLLNKIEALQEEDSDFWDTLTEHQKNEIKQGLDELDAGKKHDYESVVLKFR